MLICKYHMSRAKKVVHLARSYEIACAATYASRGHSASLRMGIPVFCLRASLPWRKHLKVLLTRTFWWPPPFLPHEGGFIAWLTWASLIYCHRLSLISAECWYHICVCWVCLLLGTSINDSCVSATTLAFAVSLSSECGQISLTCASECCTGVYLLHL